MKHLINSSAAKLGAIVALLSSTSAFAHPGHDHAGRSIFHMVSNNMMAVGALIAVLFAARTLLRRD